MSRLDRSSGYVLAGAPDEGDVARHYMAVSTPRWPSAHLIADAEGGHLFLPGGSQLYDIDRDLFCRIDQVADADHLAAMLHETQLDEGPIIDDRPPTAPAVHALSLAVAQKCNLGCVYCYAEQGAFGGVAKNMDLDTAFAAVDLLIAETAPGGKASLAFLGGEPLVNRDVLQQATRRAVQAAAGKGLGLSLAITTNGTLLTSADADFFEQYAFAVTVSLDGPQAVHDRLRPYKGGRGSFERILDNLRPILVRRRQIAVMARVNGDPWMYLGLRQTLSMPSSRRASTA